MNFVEKIAEWIKNEEVDLEHLTIVVPSERVKKYLSIAIFDVFQKPVFAPQIITSDQFVQQHSSRSIVDRTRLLVMLFSIQLAHKTTEMDSSFDEFIQWGITLLSDYDEIERYELNARDVFRNLAKIKELEGWEIDNWSFAKPILTEAQIRFMEFWDRLPIYHKDLLKELEVKGWCLKGQAYRELSENIDSLFANDPNRTFLFTGFNALSPAEISVIKQLRNLGKAEVIVELDEAYTGSQYHEAGAFLLKALSAIGLKTNRYTEPYFANTCRSIEIIECTNYTAQVKVASSILQELTLDEINETLILLADEELISPLLKNIPASVQKANITLGLPLKSTPLRTWIDLIFSVQENQHRFGTKAIYFKDLQRFWSHPFYIALLTDNEREKQIELELDLIQKNRLFISLKNIQTSDIMKEIMEMIWCDWNSDWQQAIACLRKLNRTIYDRLSKKDEFEKAILESFDKYVLDFQNIVSEGLPAMSLKSFRMLLNQHWTNKSIAFEGNPTEGLQIMGLLETRMLDFKNIIVLGLNEGSMPPTNPIQTMIPMDLRNYFGLPTPRDKQGIFAHHFYRLLHRSSNCWITYSSSQDSFGSKEKSRYLMQLELELARTFPDGFKLNHKVFSVPVGETTQSYEIEIQKDSSVLERLDAIMSKSVSASLLNKYISCPLDFYYRYVLEFGEDDSISEEVENSDFGSIIHQVLEDFYRPFARHDKHGERVKTNPPPVTQAAISAMLDRTEEAIRQKYLKHFDGDDYVLKTGKNFLSFTMAVRLTKRLLIQEKEFIASLKEPLFIEYLEATFKVPLELEIDGSEKTIQLTGNIDRIDSIGNQLRIIDYKSGSVRSDDVKIAKRKNDNSFNFTEKHVLQLMMYAYLFREKTGKEATTVAIASLVNISNGLFELYAANNLLTLKEITDYFPQRIKEIVEEMYTVNLPFQHDTEAKYCLYCQ